LQICETNELNEPLCLDFVFLYFLFSSFLSFRDKLVWVYWLAPCQSSSGIPPSQHTHTHTLPCLQPALFFFHLFLPIQSISSLSSKRHTYIPYRATFSHPQINKYHIFKPATTLPSFLPFSISHDDLAASQGLPPSLPPPLTTTRTSSPFKFTLSAGNG